MGKQTITDAQRKDIRTLFVKGYLPCETIASRIGCTRQSVHTILRKMGVDTSKRKVAFECFTCGVTDTKTRAEFRKHERHFCSSECYNASLRDPRTQKEIQALRVARDRAMDLVPYGGDPGIGIHAKGDDVYVFADRELMLEWKRTGLPQDIFSVKQGKTVREFYRGRKKV